MLSTRATWGWIGGKETCLPALAIHLWLVLSICLVLGICNSFDGICWNKVYFLSKFLCKACQICLSWCSIVLIGHFQVLLCLCFITSPRLRRSQGRVPGVWLPSCTKDPPPPLPPLLFLTLERTRNYAHPGISKFSSLGEHSFSFFQVENIPWSICVLLTSPLLKY